MVWWISKPFRLHAISFRALCWFSAMQSFLRLEVCCKLNKEMTWRDERDLGKAGSPKQRLIQKPQKLEGGWIPPSGEGTEGPTAPWHQEDGSRIVSRGEAKAMDVYHTSTTCNALSMWFDVTSKWLGEVSVEVTSLQTWCRTQGCLQPKHMLFSQDIHHPCRDGSAGTCGKRAGLVTPCGLNKWGHCVISIWMFLPSAHDPRRQTLTFLEISQRYSCPQSPPCLPFVQTHPVWTRPSCVLQRRWEEGLLHTHFKMEAFALNRLKVLKTILTWRWVDI